MTYTSVAARDTALEGGGSVSAPTKPNMTMLRIHEHDWYEIGAQLNPNGRWSSLWRCVECPDIGIGGYAGTDPAGLCGCGWVQKDQSVTACEECKRSDRFVTAPTLAAEPDPVLVSLGRWLDDQHRWYEMRFVKAIEDRNAQ